MSNITKTEVETRAAAGEDKVLTNLSIDWEGMDRDDLIALAQQTLIVKLQGQWRRTGIPTALDVKATDHKVGTRAARTPASIESLLAKLSPEDRAALLAKFTD